MIGLGIVDFDTSHAVEFTKGSTTSGSTPVEMRGWSGVPGRSEIAPATIPKNVATLKGRGRDPRHRRTGSAWSTPLVESVTAAST